MSGRVTSVQIHSLSHVWFCNPMYWNTQASLSISKSPSLLKLMSIKSVISSNHPLLCRPFSSWLQTFQASGCFPVSQCFPSGGQSIGASASASNEYSIHQWIFSPSNEYSGLTSLRMDWFDLFAAQGILKSLLQDHSSKASILQRSAFFTVQLSHPYMTTGKTIALTRWTFVGR